MQNKRIPAFLFYQNLLQQLYFPRLDLPAALNPQIIHSRIQMLAIEREAIVILIAIIIEQVRHLLP